MSFMSSLKRVAGAVTTGGLSLLAPTKVQEQIGSVSLGAQAVGAIGAGAGALAAGGTIGSALSAGGSSAFNIGTSGSQLVASGLGSLLSKAGIGTPSLPEQLSGPPDAGSPPPSSFLSGLSNLAPFARKAMPAVLPAASSRQPGGGSFMPVGFGQGAMDITGGLPAGSYSDVLPGAMMSGGMMQTAGALPLAGRIVGQVVLSASGAVRGLINSLGKFVPVAKVAELAEKYGIQVAASGLGVGLAEIAMAIVSHHSKKRKRRHRGISGRDLRTTRRTVGKIIRAHNQLAHLCGRAHLPRRSSRRAARPQFIPAGSTVIQH